MSGVSRPDRPLDVFLIAGEHSGDALGAAFMAALGKRLGGNATFRGVGGPQMIEAGLSSVFPMEEISAIGIASVLAKLPGIMRRIGETVGELSLAPPDMAVLIDNPDFNFQFARRLRQALPQVAIIQYVSPTVWAWRPRRARRMRPYVDHVLALFPFEPEVHERLGGPPCTYVGHPVLERLPELTASDAEMQARRDRPMVLVLPGSRRSEIARLAPVFGEVVKRVAAAQPRTEFVLPTLASRRAEIEGAVAEWPVQPQIVSTDAEKFSAFRRARAALAASGTVTLELALAQVPMVAAYKVPLFEEMIARAVVLVPTVIMPNIVLGENVVPEFLQRDCTAANLAGALLPLLENSVARKRQIEGFARLDTMFAGDGEWPSERAARVALEVWQRKGGRSAG